MSAALALPWLLMDARASAADVSPPAPWQIDVVHDPKKFSALIRWSDELGPVANPDVVYAVLGPYAEILDQERAWMWALNPHGYALGIKEIARGSRDRVAVDMVTALRAPIVADARWTILCHNHPSGDPYPSEADVELSEAMAMASACVGMILLDSYILGFRRAYSFRENRFLSY